MLTVDEPQRTVPRPDVDTWKLALMAFWMSLPRGRKKYFARSVTIQNMHDPYYPQSRKIVFHVTASGDSDRQLDGIAAEHHAAGASARQEIFFALSASAHTNGKTRALGPPHFLGCTSLKPAGLISHAPHPRRRPQTLPGRANPPAAAGSRIIGHLRMRQPILPTLEIDHIELELAWKRAGRRTGAGRWWRGCLVRGAPGLCALSLPASSRRR